MLSRTFGVEIEVSRGTQREALAALTAAGINARIEFYNHEVRSTWKITTDATVPFGYELVSPVLRGSDGFAELRTVLDALASTGHAVDRSAGLHVHIGVPEFGLSELKKIAKIYMKFERVIDSFMPPSRREGRNRMVRSCWNVIARRDNIGRRVVCQKAREVSEAEAFRVVDGCETEEQLRSTWGTRYRKLNLMSFWKYRTVEFRHHSGTLNADKAENWVKFCMMLVSGAANGAPKANTTPESEWTIGKETSRIFWTFRDFPGVKDLRAFFKARQRQLRWAA